MLSSQQVCSNRVNFRAMSKTNDGTLFTILCIDDEAIGLEIRKAVLERAGYRVLTALDGTSGLSLFRSEMVDGVVLDFFMPQMNGGEVAEQMRRERPDVPILLLSAFLNLPGHVVELADLTAVKGEGPEELLEKVRRLLSNGRMNSLALSSIAAHS
jgi:CheY-like chemotaxis protein